MLAELHHSNSASENGDKTEDDPSSSDVPRAGCLNLNESQSAKEDVNIDNPEDKSSTPNRASTVKVQLGTPLLYSASPFKILPSAEKFSKDICDVINFENLPDATGKYDQMSELIQKVRRRVSEMNKE